MAIGTVILTVVTAAASTDLTTLAIVKSELGKTDGADDDILRRYLSAASIVASGYCNRVFAVETLKEEIWPRRDSPPSVVCGSLSRVQLVRYPVIALTSVTENGAALVAGTDFVIDNDKGQIT